MKNKKYTINYYFKENGILINDVLIQDFNDFLDDYIKKALDLCEN